MDNPNLTKKLPPYEAWVSRSREILAPIVALAQVESALDLGCNCGPWLGALNDLGVSDVMGVNDLEIWDNILFDRKCAVVHDLSQPLELNRRFDLVLCLEVAEHVGGGDEGAAELMRTITRHGDRVLFSAATPGQWGDGHVNCQPHEYWHERFASYGYQVWDVMRPLLRDRTDTENWYKSNMFLYTRTAGLRNSRTGAQMSDLSRTLKLPDAYSSDLIDREWTFYVRCVGSRVYDDVGLLTSRLPKLRTLYPGARIVVSAHWESLRNSDELRRAATASGCECLPHDADMHQTERGAACLRAMLDIFVADTNSQFLVKFDPDTQFHHRLSPPVRSGAHGCPETQTSGGDVIVPSNLQGGCIVYTRDAAEALSRHARLDDPAYWADYAETWAKGVNDWLSHAKTWGTLDDAISRHACLIAGVPMCVHPEVASFYTSPDEPDWWKGFAVTHPHKK